MPVYTGLAVAVSLMVFLCAKGPVSIPWRLDDLDEEALPYWIGSRKMRQADAWFGLSEFGGYSVRKLAGNRKHEKSSR
jgi:hypothetical protein